jgi:hypothetical protein
MAAECSPGREPGDQAWLEPIALEEGGRKSSGTDAEGIICRPFRGSETFFAR